MDVRIGSNQISTHVNALIKNSQRALPEESRSIILRLPVDSVALSPASRALQRGHLRVGLDDDGSGQYTKVTDESTNPVMSLLEDGMNAVKKNLDEMKELTELMEDEKISPEDRYATQIRLVELEGELEKHLYDLNERYRKMAGDQGLSAQANLWDMAKGQASAEAVLDAGWTYDSEKFYIADRMTGEMFGFKKHSEMVDKRTQLRKDAINRVRMRELDPEAYEKYEEGLRETLRAEFRAKADVNGYIRDTSREAMALKDIIFAPEMKAMMYPAKELADPEPLDLPPVAESGVTLPDATLGSTDGFVRVPVSPEVDLFAQAMESFVEERLAEIEKGDYEEFNGMRVSVMSAELAAESGDYLENLTNQLTEQFKKFAATNELVDAEEPSPDRDDKRMIQIANIARVTINFLKDTVLHAIQKSAVRGGNA